MQFKISPNLLYIVEWPKGLFSPSRLIHQEIFITGMLFSCEGESTRSGDSVTSEEDGVSGILHNLAMLR